MQNIPVRPIAPTANEPGLAGSFSIRSIATLLAGNDMVEPLHRHDFYYLLVLKNGDGQHEIDFTPYKVSDNTLFLMRPGQVHELRLKATSQGYLLQFRHDFFDSQQSSYKTLLRKVSHKQICAVEPVYFKKLLRILDCIFTEFTQKRESYQQAIQSNLILFFIELLRQRQNDQTPAATAKAYPQEQLEKFLELLDANIAGCKQVSQYASLLHLSAYQLAAVTKSLLGKTPSNLINEHIVLESKRLLLATSNQVNQIAYQLGYEDPSYFIRFFKKHTGHSPESFRNISR